MQQRNLQQEIRSMAPMNGNGSQTKPRQKQVESMYNELNYYNYTRGPPKEMLGDIADEGDMVNVNLNEESYISPQKSNFADIGRMKSEEPAQVYRGAEIEMTKFNTNNQFSSTPNKPQQNLNFMKDGVNHRNPEHENPRYRGLDIKTNAVEVIYRYPEALKNDIEMPIRGAFYRICQCLCVCIGPLTYGYHTSSFNAISGVFQKINAWQNEDDWTAYNAIITAAYPLGYAFGLLYAPFLLKKFIYEIRQVFIIIDIFVIAVNVFLIAEMQAANFIVGRFMMGGLASLLNTFALPYLKHCQIGFLALPQFSFFTGVVLGLFTAYFLPSFSILRFMPSYYDPATWRIIHGLPIFFALVQIFGLSVVFQQDVKVLNIDEDNSPQELVHSFDDQFKQQQHIDLLQEFYQQETNETLVKERYEQKEFNEIFDPFKLTRNQRILLAILIAIGSQLTAIHVFHFYSVTIYRRDWTSMVYENSAGGHAMGALFHIFSMQLAKRASQKIVYLIAMFEVVVCLALVAYYQSFTSSYGTFFAMWVMFLGFQFSYNCMERQYIPKLVDFEGKKVYEMTKIICIFIVALVTPFMFRHLGFYVTFIIYAAGSFIMIVVFAIFMKDLFLLTKPSKIALEFCRPQDIPEIVKNDEQKDINVQNYYDYLKYHRKKNLRHRAKENGIGFPQSENDSLKIF